MRSLSILSLALLALAAAMAGCSSDPVGNPGPIDIPFDLMIPPNRPAADYYATSGVVTTRRSVKVGDSIVESSIPSFYAQFNTSGPAVPLPALVTLNTNPLDSNRNTDTLRLESVVENSNVLGENVWVLSGAGGSPASFTVQRVDVVDSVTPFETRGSVRSDTPLVIRWKRPAPGTPSSGMYMVWKAPGKSPLAQTMDDGIGQYTMDTSALKALRGRGSVTFLRYYTLDRTYNGKRIILQRLAQRTYGITVE